MKALYRVLDFMARNSDALTGIILGLSLGAILWAAGYLPI